MSGPVEAAVPTIGRTRVARRLMVACAAALGAQAAWSLWPLPRSAEPSAPLLATPAPPPPDARIALNTDAFRAPIWVSPAPPPAPPAAAPPPPPLRVQLLAITHEGGAHRAVLYDPATDRLHILADGDSFQRHTVERVLANGVDFRGERGVQTVTLSADRAP